MKAVSIGELTVDWLSLEHGESMMTATLFYRYLGGNAANVSVGLARLGLDSAIISRVGDDIHGQYLLSCLHKEGVDCSQVSIDPTQSTSQCYMTRRLDGSPDYYSWPSPNASKMLQVVDIKDEYFEDSWVWHAAAVSFIAKPRRFAMLYAIERARALNKLISFDACFPDVESDGGRKAAWKAMGLSDILKFNLSELRYWSGANADAEISDMAGIILKKMSPALLVVTLAEKGAMLYSGGRGAFCPPYLVDSVGDVGPGDAFSAGLIYALSSRKNEGTTRASVYKIDMNEWQELARYGACTGALVTRAQSATEKFPSLNELELALGKTSPRS